MTTCFREHCTTSINDPHRFITEASSLNLKPGEWPEKIDTDLGNGQPLVLWSMNGSRVGTELYHAEYRQSLGCVSVIIFND